MSLNPQDDIFTIGVGGAAGDGVKRAGIALGQYLENLGYEVYLSFTYPSLIRGGHNFSRLTFSKEKIWHDHTKLDILIVSNEESIELHKSELKEGAKTLTDLPLSKIPENPEAVFGGINLERGEPRGRLIDGNAALAEGFVAAGLDFYFAYPMTPSTSILHHLASKQKPDGFKVIQPESEISVINMALGAAYAGKRAAVGTATGGFALMQETFSLAGMTELPLAIAVSQRQAPATGIPTHSSQSDLQFIIHSGHGEFPRIIIAPGDPEESFKAGAEALNMAWKYRVPTVILLDKILSENMTMSSVDSSSVSVQTSDAVLPGTPNAVVKVSSYEHNDCGLITDKPEDVKKRVERRFAKLGQIKEEMKSKETVKVYGQDSENAVVFWGSTKGAALEAAKYLNKPAKLVQVIWVEPLDEERMKKELEGKKIICVEGNHNGQLAGLIREKTGIEANHKILKYDSAPFDPEELAKQINNLI